MVSLFHWQISFHIDEVIDEPRYCNNNATTPRATNFTYQPRVCTNLEVIVLYAQVEVKVMPVVIAHMRRDPKGSKSDFYRVRRSLILMEEKQIYSKGELLYCNKEANNHVVKKSHHTLANQLNNYAKNNY